MSIIEKALDRLEQQSGFEPEKPKHAPKEAVDSEELEPPVEPAAAAPAEAKPEEPTIPGVDDFFDDLEPPRESSPVADSGTPDAPDEEDFLTLSPEPVQEKPLASSDFGVAPDISVDDLDNIEQEPLAADLGSADAATSLDELYNRPLDLDESAAPPPPQTEAEPPFPEYEPVAFDAPDVPDDIDAPSYQAPAADELDDASEDFEQPQADEVREEVDMAEEPSNGTDLPMEPPVEEKQPWSVGGFVKNLFKRNKAAPALEDETPTDEAAAESEYDDRPRPVYGTRHSKNTSRHIKLDMERLRQQGLLTPDMSRSQLAEEFRVIKRPLLLNAFGQGATKVENGNLIMVSSGLPGEGKTFTSVNLAMSVAMEMDRTVLLVDCDIARPSLTKLFGFDEELGLIDVLVEDSVQLSDVLLRTDVPKLTILPAGTRHHNATELLASDYMRSLSLELSRRYPDRVVIFDTPPLMATSQAAVMSRLVGQVVVVVEAGRAPQHVIKEALTRVEAAEIVGLVLNKTGQEFGSDYYYYYGYGYYGYGSNG